MKALVFEDGQAQLTDRPDPTPPDGWISLRPLVCGVCNTDLEIVRGYMGFAGTLGHEVVAEVLDGPRRGQRVTCEINFACGRCPACAQGMGRHCPHRSVLGILNQDGVFAERMVAPPENLHPVPDALTSDRAVFVEPLAAAFEILEQVHVAPGTEALVLGDGKLGMLVAQVLRMAGAEGLVVGKHDDHLAMLRDRGIDTVRLDAWDRTARPLVVEATGTAAGFELAMAATRARGTLVLKSTVADRPAVDLAPLVIHEIRVVGSRCGPFAPAVAALADGRIDVTPMVAGRYALSDGVAALEHAGRRGTLKVLIEVGSQA